MSCMDGTGWSSLGSTPNLSDWRASDSVSLDLDAGTYWFAWRVSNVIPGGSSNPAGLLAEILWSGGSNVSSSAWEVSDDHSNWSAATSYGSNGGANIWTSVNGGPVAGIGTDANWLWTSYNNNIEMDNTAWFRTSVTISQVQVPEPGTLALLGLGLAGIGFSRRRKI
ncbi:MAG: PEP-CTERM sorting domain-containing protein [Halioglobus sp.]|nr:PEP-CTERM sorting domain-containing protein [Halioglobus sp.]